ncbi:MAG: hypothetical protein ACLQNU_03540 [Candidatus Dormibacteria bacterium]
MAAPTLLVPASGPAYQPAFWTDRRDPAALNMRQIATPEQIHDRVRAVAQEIATEQWNPGCIAPGRFYANG